MDVKTTVQASSLIALLVIIYAVIFTIEAYKQGL